MITTFAETSVEIFGKNVTDPKLQLVSLVAFVFFFVGVLALTLTTRMIDEQKVRAEPSISSLFGKGLPPARILTSTGQRFRVAGIASVGIGLVAFVIIALISQ